MTAGFVGYDADGHFLHFCHCGADASFGYDVSMLRGQLGTWFCAEHRPPPEPIEQPPPTSQHEPPSTARKKHAPPVNPAQGDLF